MKNLINGIHLQFFAEDDVESYNDVDFGVAFADDSESSVESETQEPSTETQGEENVEIANQQTEEVEIPNEVWKKARLKAEREADAKIKKMQEQFNNSFADDEYLGKINPYTNKAIRTKQDQQEYLETYSKDTLKQNGLDEQDFKRIRKMIYGEYVKEYNDVGDIARMFLADFMKGINCFDYIEEIETVDVTFAKRVLEETFNLDKMVISVVK